MFFSSHAPTLFSSEVGCFFNAAAAVVVLVELRGRGKDAEWRIYMYVRVVEA